MKSEVLATAHDSFCRVRPRGPRARDMEPLDPSILSDVADKAPDFPPLLSVGVLSVGEHNYQRRWEQRQTWFGLAQKQSNPLSLVYARFVVRCGARMYSSAPYSPSDALLGENATHGDIVCTDIAEDAGKLKGPSLLVLAWYDHALRVQPRTRFIATVDDDAYVHLAPNGILDILRELPSYAATGRTYVGAMHGWTFNATQYRFLRFGWSGTGDAAEGPFPFATGAFMCVSRGLATQIYSATREEAKLVTALPPRHPVFYQVRHCSTACTTHFTHQAHFTHHSHHFPHHSFLSTTTHRTPSSARRSSASSCPPTPQHQ